VCVGGEGVNGGVRRIIEMEERVEGMKECELFAFGEDLV